MIHRIIDERFTILAKKLPDDLFKEHSIIGLGLPRAKIYSQLRFLRTIQNDMNVLIISEKNNFKINGENRWNLIRRIYF